jgi:hypothetical protein
MTLNHVQNLKHLWDTTYGDMTIYEYNQSTNALPRKYVWVFNSKGENITQMVASVLDRKTSRSQKFYGAIMTSGYGFHFAAIIIDGLQQKNYRNENDIRFHYFTDNGQA